MLLNPRYFHDLSVASISKSSSSWYGIQVSLYLYIWMNFFLALSICLLEIKRFHFSSVTVLRQLLPWEQNSSTCFNPSSFLLVTLLLFFILISIFVFFPIYSHFVQICQCLTYSTMQFQRTTNGNNKLPVTRKWHCTDKTTHWQYTKYTGSRPLRNIKLIWSCVHRRVTTILSQPCKSVHWCINEVWTCMNNICFKTVFFSVLKQSIWQKGSGACLINCFLLLVSLNITFFLRVECFDFKRIPTLYTNNFERSFIIKFIIPSFIIKFNVLFHFRRKGNK